MKPDQKKIFIFGVLIILSESINAGIGSSVNQSQKGLFNSLFPGKQKAEIQKVKVVSLPIPEIGIKEISFIKTVIVPTAMAGDQVLDVSLIDDFITDVTPNVRHYPPNFPSATQKYNTRENIKYYVDYIKSYANNPNASYDILMRAAVLNGMARNLDLGTEYTVNASKYVSRAIKLQPESIEANLLYGIMLSESGAFKTSRKYLDKAVLLGSVEAEQTIAQSDLMNDQRDEALIRLKKLQMNDMSNSQLAAQIKIIEEGGYRIWDLPAPNINVKPIS